MKILCSDPQKALPCVNTRLFVYRVSKSVQRPELYVGRKILRTKKLKKIRGNFGYMGTSKPWGGLDRMWHVGEILRWT